MAMASSICSSGVVRGVVRHAFKAPPSLAGFTKPGMGVEFIDLPDDCREYLASL